MEYLVILILIIAIIVLWKMAKKLFSFALIALLIYFLYQNFDTLKEIIPIP